MRLRSRSGHRSLRQLIVGPVTDRVAEFTPRLNGGLETDKLLFAYKHTPLAGGQRNAALLRLSSPPHLEPWGTADEWAPEAAAAPADPAPTRH